MRSAKTTSPELTKALKALGYSPLNAGFQTRVFGQAGELAQELAKVLQRNAELRDALFKLRGAVDGILPGYVYLNECKARADMVLKVNP